MKRTSLPLLRRREFIILLGGTAAALPPLARAQQAERMRRIGVINTLAADDPDVQPRNMAFLQRLQQLGWSDGQNVQINYRWRAGNIDNARKYAKELVALAPDVILATGSSALGPLLQTSQDIPTVFVIVPDPVGSGFVDSLARPGGNATGFLSFEFGISGKWLELLKEIVPSVKRAGVVRDSSVTAGIGQWGALQSAAPAVGLELHPVDVRNAAEIEKDVAAVARISSAGLIVTAGPGAALHRDLLINLSARHKLPAVYYERNFVAAGGLVSYGPDFVDQYRQAAGYVDRILKGEKPADMPVQAPTKYELIVNLKTAKALDIDLPPSLLARADEVIE